ncbi:lyso-ornithine lipid acyltransferase [Cognatiyoonia koreensis]|uniref:Lyso-ornithine lipid acyltransferase n=1 Tax=Cognatiyoonia koreensis TaxID=364200 RepID=A0A1I0PAD2_9RHOB|nr:lysophospholipid acyltransferase family protein [Cognatiyoonia koreensis]SEW11231.1 lyso-ornithine lipid acyltransferase [Cognatiyoonia koreensis]
MNSPTWQSKDIPPGTPISTSGWLRVAIKGFLLIALIAICLILLLLLRLIEAPLCGERRPVTPFITQFVCRTAFRIIGIRYRIIGKPMPGPGAVVANHSSWLDIFALNAGQRITFVAKEEVAGWAGIGWLAKATGTVFVKRDRRESLNQIEAFKERLAVDQRLLFFPEGTSTDGLQVLPFKPTLFAAFFAPEFTHLSLQAVTVRYEPAPSQDRRFYGWWGNMDLAPHLLATLAASPQGGVTVIYHPPVQIDDFESRKTLARSLEDQTRSGLTPLP